MLDSFLDLTLPYITNDLPGIGGQLRVTPEHFVVEELALYEPQGEGQHLYVNLTKVGYTTQEIQTQLERLFKLKKGDVSFAGMKDKAARTTQTFSLAIGHQPPEFAQEAVQRIGDHLPVEVHWANFHRNKLRLGHLLGNRFTITVADLACDAEIALARTQAIATRLTAIGLPNFFGPQRFGSTGRNLQQGLDVLRGQGGRKDRWLRRFLISAVQSYLCNRYLAQRVAMGAFFHLVAGDVAKKHATGGMFDVVDVAVENPRYLAQEISFTAPMYGPKMWAAQAAAGELEAAVLAATPVTIAQLAAVRVEGTRRLGRLLINDWSISANQAGWGVATENASGSNDATGNDATVNEATLTIAFTLPKGAFATTVLREFMKVEAAQLAEIDEDE